MLHILLLILKIIGIILAVILGILILLVCIILFVPIRYEISAKCDGTIESLKAKVKATWLLHLIRADVFLKGKRLKWKVRLAWLKKTNVAGETSRKEVKSDEAKEDKSQEFEKTVVDDTGITETPESTEEKFENSSEETKEQRRDEAEGVYKDERKADSKRTETKSKETKNKNFIEKIKSSIQKICEKIKDLLQKKEKITDFLTEKSHVNAFRKAKKGLIVLLRRLKPKKMNIKLRFGFDDPCTTGQVLGGLSILYPFLGDTAEIIPDFEKQILEGNVYLKGRIRFCHFAVLALKLLLCKDVRTSYKDIRNFKL